MTSPWLLLFSSTKSFLLFKDCPITNIRRSTSTSMDGSSPDGCCWRRRWLLNRVTPDFSTISTSSSSNIFCRTWRGTVTSLSHWISSLKKTVRQIMDALFQWHRTRCRMDPTVNQTVHLVSIINIHTKITSS
jgi:hypothetical protein